MLASTSKHRENMSFVDMSMLWCCFYVIVWACSFFCQLLCYRVPEGFFSGDGDEAASGKEKYFFKPTRQWTIYKQTINDEIGQTNNRNQARWKHFFCVIEKTVTFYFVARFHPWFFLIRYNTLPPPVGGLPYKKGWPYHVLQMVTCHSIRLRFLKSWVWDACGSIGFRGETPLKASNRCKTPSS